jgi:hypothetical protein
VLRPRCLVAGVLATAALALPAAAHAAGSYTVYMCATPNGAPVPAGGVTLDASQTGAAAANTCGAPGGVLRAGLIGTAAWSPGEYALVHFSAPQSAAITSVSLTRSTVGLTTMPPPPADKPHLSYRLDSDTGPLEGCGANGLPPTCTSEFTGTFAKAGLSTSFLQVKFSCDGSAPDICAHPPDAHVDVSQATFTVADSTAPTLSNVRGALFAAGPARGIITVQFNAADAGGGLYRAFTLVDDKVVSTQPLDQKCADVDRSDTNPYEFSSLQPCVTTLTDFTMPIDTTKLDEGIHTFAVQIEDAAGNKVTVAGPKGVRVENLNGINADQHGTLKVWFVKTHTAIASSIRGERVVIRGTLLNRHHKGINGAIVDVYHYVGKHRLSKTGLKTRRGGRMTLILPKNVFGDKNGLRKLLFVYRVKRPGPATSKQRLGLTIRYPSGKPLYRPVR